MYKQSCTRDNLHCTKKLGQMRANIDAKMSHIPISKRERCTYRRKQSAAIRLSIDVPSSTFYFNLT